MGREIIPGPTPDRTILLANILVSMCNSKPEGRLSRISTASILVRMYDKDIDILKLHALFTYNT